MDLKAPTSTPIEREPTLFNTKPSLNSVPWITLMLFTNSEWCEWYQRIWLAVCVNWKAKIQQNFLDRWGKKFCTFHSGIAWALIQELWIKIQRTQCKLTWTFEFKISRREDYVLTLLAVVLRTFFYVLSSKVNIRKPQQWSNLSQILVRLKSSTL